MKYIVNWFDILDICGGSEIIAKQFQEQLGFQPVSYNSAGATMNYKPLPFYGLGFAEVEGGVLICDYLNRLEEIEKPELFVINSMINAWKKFKTHTICLFQDCHAQGADALKDFYGQYDYNRIRHVFNKLQYLSGVNSDCNMAVSNFCKEAIEKHTGLKDLKVIEHGVNTELFKPLGSEERMALRKTLLPQVDNSCPIVFYNGRFHPQKGAHIIAKLARDFPKCHFLLSYMQQISWKPKLKNVSILPPMPQAKLRAMYGIADVTLIPSACESFGLTSMESCACGTPIITTKTGVWWDYRPAEAGYFCDWTYESFAQKLEQFLKKEQTFNPRKIAEGFTLERWKKNWLGLF